MKAELGELAADLLDGLVGEGDPDPLADDFGEVVLGGQPTAQQFEKALGREGAVVLALLEVHIGKD